VTRCPAPDCTSDVDVGVMMCHQHWSKVPAGVRDAVTRTYAAWKANRADVATFRAYRAAVDAAVLAVDPWHVDTTGWCLCPCHRDAGDHGDAECSCTTVAPASCLRCRESIAVHAISPDSLHGDIATVCPDQYADWAPIAGVTTPQLRSGMRDAGQLELVPS